jgi:hypothetical protein
MRGGAGDLPPSQPAPRVSSNPRPAPPSRPWPFQSPSAAPPIRPSAQSASLLSRAGAARRDDKSRMMIIDEVRGLGLSALPLALIPAWHEIRVTAVGPGGGRGQA